MAQGAASQKLWIEVLMMAKKKNKKQVKNFGLIKQHGVTPSIKVALRATKEQVDANGAHFCRKL